MGSWLHHSPHWLSSTQATISILRWWSRVFCPHHNRNHLHLLTSFVPSYWLASHLQVAAYLQGSISLYFNLLLLLHNWLILIRVMIFIASLHNYSTFLDKVISPFWVSSRSMVPICISMVGKLVSIFQLLDSTLICSFTYLS